jgi:hypothetical protein
LTTSVARLIIGRVSIGREVSVIFPCVKYPRDIFSSSGPATPGPPVESGVIIVRCHRLTGGLSMSLQDRIGALKEKHAALERAIDEENARPLPNDDAISDLKRQKLRIKDEIFQLESQ